MSFYESHIQLFTSDSNSKIITHKVLKIHEWFWGMCMSGVKFLKPWQVTDNIIERILSQFTFNILWVTLTQKIITCRVLKIHKWFWGDVYGQGKFLKPWQVTDKIIEWIFPQFTFNFLWVTLTQKIITHRVSKIHEWLQGDVYEQGKVS